MGGTLDPATLQGVEESKSFAFGSRQLTAAAVSSMQFGTFECLQCNMRHNLWAPIGLIPWYYTLLKQLTLSWHVPAQPPTLAYSR